jgi:hypothetical protein
MPLGFERLNERIQRPNALINFIRPLPGSSSATAENILNRVAAICYPFMKSNMILVQALEEFPFNKEFVGRNFNAGEVIQLVLKDRNGRWLPQKMVEMVMVHELAHCKQMNHSKAFWKVRDAYAVDLRGLWGKRYTGEGMWGRGRGLESGAVQQENVDPGDVPEHLCGGTYGRSRKRGRGGKTKETLSYAERKQRRILKKFGAGGNALGADDETKVKLEGGVAKKGKPRVAGSARGRDLRAAAALARFDTVKKENVEIKNEETLSNSETEDEYEEGSEHAAIDVDGQKMTDGKGRALVKICEEEDDKDGDARREMDEIQGLDTPKTKTKASDPSSGKSSSSLQKIGHVNSTTNQAPHKGASATNIKGEHPSKLHSSKSSPQVVRVDEMDRHRKDPPAKRQPTHTQTCAICSLLNEPGSVTCMACSNVLNPHLVANHWKCSGTVCKSSQYVNSGDAGRCGVCGAAKAAL